MNNQLNNSILFIPMLFINYIHQPEVSLSSLKRTYQSKPFVKPSFLIALQALNAPIPILISAKIFTELTFPCTSSPTPISQQFRPPPTLLGYPVYSQIPITPLLLALPPPTTSRSLSLPHLILLHPPNQSQKLMLRSRSYNSIANMDESNPDHPNPIH